MDSHSTDFEMRSFFAMAFFVLTSGNEDLLNLACFPSNRLDNKQLRSNS